MKAARLDLSPTTGREKALLWVASVLAANNIEDPAGDARALLCAAAHITCADLVRDPGLELDEGATRRLIDFTDRRVAREPVSRILGSRGFWTFDLLVTPAVLDPRPDTETLVEAALQELAARRRDTLQIADLGTGSGALLCALLGEFPAAAGVGIDISIAACTVARQNLRRCGHSDRAEIVAGDWEIAKGRRYDLVVANPPYVESEEICALPPEVRDYDPRVALDGGSDGLDAYRAIVGLLPEILAPAGVAILETGAGQGDAVRDLLQRAGLTAAPPRCDLAGHPRAVVTFLRPHGIAIG